MTHQHRFQTHQHREVSLPAGLLDTLRTFEADPAGCWQGIKATIRSLFDTVVWQGAWIDRLEQRLREAGVALPPQCFNCQSDDVAILERDGQRRMVCRQCEYRWRIGYRR